MKYFHCKLCNKKFERAHDASEHIEELHSGLPDEEYFRLNEIWLQQLMGLGSDKGQEPLGS
jgi:hypothetical protein